MRQRAFDRCRHAITTNHGLCFNVQSRIGAAPRGEINQPPSNLVWIVAKVQSAARGGDAAFDDRLLDRAVELHRQRSHHVAEIVTHDQGVAAFDAQLVEHGSLGEFELTALFDRRLRALIDQVGQLDVFGVFGPMHLNVAADELDFRISAQLKIGSNRRAKILRIIERHLVAVNVEEELRD